MPSGARARGREAERAGHGEGLGAVAVANAIKVEITGHKGGGRGWEERNGNAPRPPSYPIPTHLPIYPLSPITVLPFLPLLTRPHRAHTYLPTCPPAPRNKGMGVSVRANTLPINRDFPLPRARPPASSSHGFYVLVTYLRVTYRDGEGGVKDAKQMAPRRR